MGGPRWKQRTTIANQGKQIVPLTTVILAPRPVVPTTCSCGREFQN